jgi:hypothetical protein
MSARDQSAGQPHQGGKQRADFTGQLRMFLRVLHQGRPLAAAETTDKLFGERFEEVRFRGEASPCLKLVQAPGHILQDVLESC